MQNVEHLRPDRADRPVVMVVDDEVLIVNILRIVLEKDGYFVLTAQNGEEALFVSRQFPGEIHCLLSDIQMPKMNGLDLSKRFASERPGARIIIMSGQAQAADMPYPFLQKPFHAAGVSRIIRGLLPVNAKAGSSG